MPRDAPNTNGDYPPRSPSAYGRKFSVDLDEAIKVSNRILKEIFTPTIKIYGEAIIELEGKKYLVNAPEGVTIRERNDLDN